MDAICVTLYLATQNTSVVESVCCINNALPNLLRRPGKILQNPVEIYGPSLDPIRKDSVGKNAASGKARRLLQDFCTSVPDV
jgi:hypothetical protein